MIHIPVFGKAAKLTALGLVAVLAIKQFTQKDFSEFFGEAGKGLVGFILRWKVPNSRWARFASLANRNIVIMGTKDQTGQVVRQKTVLAHDLDDFLERSLPIDGEPLEFRI